MGKNKDVLFLEDVSHLFRLVLELSNNSVVNPDTLYLQTIYKEMTVKERQT